MPNWSLLTPIIFNTNRKLGGHRNRSTVPNNLGFPTVRFPQLSSLGGSWFFDILLLIVWPVYSCILDLVTQDRQVPIAVVGFVAHISSPRVCLFLHKAGWDKLSENMAPLNHCHHFLHKNGHHLRKFPPSGNQRQWKNPAFMVDCSVQVSMSWCSIAHVELPYGKCMQINVNKCM